MTLQYHDNKTRTPRCITRRGVTVISVQRMCVDHCFLLFFTIKKHRRSDALEAIYYQISEVYHDMIVPPNRQDANIPIDRYGPNTT